MKLKLDLEQRIHEEKISNLHSDLSEKYFEKIKEEIKSATNQQSNFLTELNLADDKLKFAEKKSNELEINSHILSVDLNNKINMFKSNIKELEIKIEIQKGKNEAILENNKKLEKEIKDKDYFLEFSNEKVIFFIN